MVLQELSQNWQPKWKTGWLEFLLLVIQGASLSFAVTRCARCWVVACGICFQDVTESCDDFSPAGRSGTWARKRKGKKKNNKMDRIADESSLREMSDEMLGTHNSWKCTVLSSQSNGPLVCVHFRLQSRCSNRMTKTLPKQWEFWLPQKENRRGNDNQGNVSLSS